MVSLATPSLVCSNAGRTQGSISRPVFCPPYASGRHWPLRNVGHCFNTVLCDTIKCYNTMSIFSFDQPLWWMAVKTIKNNPEPNLHGIILRLGGFHTLVNCLQAVSCSGLWSLLTFTENTVTHILGGNVYGWAVIGPSWKIMILTQP